jgi:cytochrome c-type biogenesis protein
MTSDISVEFSDPRPDSRAVVLRFARGLAGLVILALVGYGLFRAFAEGALGAPGYALVAIVAGVGAFFSPCTFPLLPSYLAYVEALDFAAAAGSRWRILRGRVAAAAGVTAFNGLLGVAFALMGLGLATSFALVAPSPSPTTVALRAVVGGSLVVLGVIQLANLSIHGPNLDRIVRRFQSRRSRDADAALFLYGFGYTVAGVGCTAPFLGTVVVVSLASGGPLAALAGFLLFAATMAALMVVSSAFALGSRRKAWREWSRRTPWIKRAAGGMLAAFGAFAIASSLAPSVLQPLFP